MPSLTDRVVVITGASSGIGEASARRLARAGARLVLSARRADRIESLARELDPSGSRVLVVPGDIRLPADRESLVARARERFGRIDALVNNAGYGTRGPVEIVPLELIRANYETNIFALVGLSQLVIPVMREQESRGRIVNIGSVAGRISRPLSSVYDSTKHALEALTDGMRGELRPFGIDVVLVRPGFIWTEFVESADRVSQSVVSQPGPYAPYMAAMNLSTGPVRRLAGVPDDIASLVERALTDARPRSHYAGPGHAHLILFLKWLLPARAIDWLVRMRVSG